MGFTSVEEREVKVRKWSKYHGIVKESISEQQRLEPIEIMFSLR